MFIIYLIMEIRPHSVRRSTHTKSRQRRTHEHTHTITATHHRPSLKVLVEYNDRLYRRILSGDQYTKNSSGQIVLPPNHVSRGYVKRVYDEDWEDFPPYDSRATLDNITAPDTIRVQAKRVVAKQSNKKKSNKKKFSHLNRQDHSEKEKIEKYIREQRSKEKVEMTHDKEWQQYINWRQRNGNGDSCTNTGVSLRQFLLDGLDTEFPYIFHGNNNILQYYGLRNAIQAVIQFDKKSDICPKHIPDDISWKHQKELYALIHMAEREANDQMDLSQPNRNVMVKMFLIQALSTKHQLISDVYVEQMLDWYIEQKRLVRTKNV